MSFTWTQQSNSGAKNWKCVSSNSDGTKLVACVYGESIYTSSNSGTNWIQTNSILGSWQAVASSSDGIKLVACIYNGLIYTSTDSGVTWNPQTVARIWSSVASSSNGTKLVACVRNGSIWTSTDSGVIWTERTSLFPRIWTGVASSSDGSKLVACVQNGSIWTSSDSGVIWTERTSAGTKNWLGVASSSDGSKLVACVQNGSIWTSSDSGATWTERTSAGTKNWVSVASNSDGTNLVACVFSGLIYTSNNSGATLIPQTSAGSKNWVGVASNNNGTKLVALAQSSNIYTGVLPYPCFKEGSKILTDKGYLPIEQLRKGDLIKTLKNGFLPIVYIGKRVISHSASNERVKHQLYQCSPSEYPELDEDLILTGCHSLLVPSFKSEEEKEKTNNINGDIYGTDGLYRLPACIDERTTVYEIPGSYTIYHLALENNDYYMNYGIYANGLLVESCSQRYIKELSNMELIE